MVPLYKNRAGDYGPALHRAVTSADAVPPYMLDAFSAFTSTLTWRGLAASFLGRVTVSTPFLNSAAIFSVSKVLGTAKLRTKLP